MQPAANATARNVVLAALRRMDETTPRKLQTVPDKKRGTVADRLTTASDPVAL
jgi:hypothetical protein